MSSGDTTLGESIEKRAALFADRYKAVYKELGKVIVGHGDILHGVLTCLFCGGHTLLEGVPGLGKTLLIKTLSEVLDLDFSRVQFTPDLMPADILGTNMIVEDADGRRRFEFQRGPVFTQICLADEINRATPKTQSAMLEAMQEKRVSAGGQTFDLERPFFVMATQNPIEQEGTYPLPEAQLDRFFFKLVVGYSGREDLNEILERTTKGTVITPNKVMAGEEILEHQQLIREVILAPHVQDYIAPLDLWQLTPKGNMPRRQRTNTSAGEAARGALRPSPSPRKVRALLGGRYNVSFEDVRRVYLPALRHRVILNFEAEAEKHRSGQCADGDFEIRA